MKTIEIAIVSGNANKVREFQEVMVENVKLVQFDIDLPEFQAATAEEVTEKKLEAAKEALKMNNWDGPCFVDDTSLEFEAMGGLPGPFIKWFLKSCGREGLYKSLIGHNNFNATARCSIGYFDGENDHIFSGTCDGTIVEPRGDYFGWDPIFQPKGFDKTYAEMESHEKHAISHRGNATKKLVELISS
eukprot:TRINITY_DN11794_c0_g1_i1.p1 TRINITY_DN11794_c0_g1~~TRINITY_DN11794_c0_g1_i1.p1  ORF type:complete len:204 (+),score=67.02 TRINITY_DN11794_c0_g1_i1:49-612(+)